MKILTEANLNNQISNILDYITTNKLREYHIFLNSEGNLVIDRDVDSVREIEEDDYDNMFYGFVNDGVDCSSQVVHQYIIANGLDEYALFTPKQNEESLELIIQDMSDYAEEWMNELFNFNAYKKHIESISK